MSLLDIDRPTRKIIPDAIIACKVPVEIQDAFEQLAHSKYNFTRAELMRACVLDCLKRHEMKIKWPLIWNVTQRIWLCSRQILLKLAGIFFRF